MKETYLVLILIILIICLALSLFAYSQYSQPHKTILQIPSLNSSTLYIKTYPISLDIVNNTKLTSLVSSTEQVGNHIDIHLMDNILIHSNRTDIKSGDVIQLDTLIYKAHCTTSLINGNKTLENNSYTKVTILNDMRCSNGYSAIQILDWSKLNQK